MTGTNLEGILTKEELKFLKSQRLSAADVYDGRMYSSAKDRGHYAKTKGKLLVLRDPTHSRCGHRLTTRAGHCVKCDTSKIAYARRHDEPAFVYIAGSRQLTMIKIGITQDIDRRKSSLNGQAYAGAKDWDMLFHVRFLRAGAVETLSRTYLPKSDALLTTVKEGRKQEAKEVCTCSFEDAYQAVAKAAHKLKLKPQNQAWRSRRAKDY